MKEYIERDKLNELIDREIEVCNSGMIRGALEYLKAIVPSAADVVSKAAFDQVMWERDVAIQQLREDYGVGLGEKKPEVKRGEWKWNEYGQMFCNVCGEFPELAIEKPFCPNCGADMRSHHDSLCDQTEEVEHA